MSSSDRRAALALLGAVALAACGFTPVHAPAGGEAGALRGAIRPADPSDALGYAFVARFEDRLGRAQAPRWTLEHRITTKATPVGVSPDNRIARYTYAGTLAWALRPVSGGEPVLSGTLSDFTAYSATGTTVATEAARRDAQDRLAVILADQLVTRLYAAAGQIGP